MRSLDQSREYDRPDREPSTNPITKSIDSIENTPTENPPQNMRPYNSTDRGAVHSQQPGPVPTWSSNTEYTNSDSLTSPGPVTISTTQSTVLCNEPEKIQMAQQTAPKIIYRLVTYRDGRFRKTPLHIGGLGGKTLDTLTALISDISGLVVEELELQLTTSYGDIFHRFRRGEEVEYNLGIDEFTAEINAQFRENRNDDRPFVLTITPMWSRSAIETNYSQQNGFNI
jgi:hypothetical protein